MQSENTLQPELDAPRPEFSVLIGRVSTEDDRRLLETLGALEQQTGAHSFEVIISDRIGDQVSEEIQRRFPAALWISAPAGTSLPRLRYLALKRSRGALICVTEDHCVPARNWFESIARAFDEAPETTLAVGGCVENGVTARSLDWATFFCEYSFFLRPVQEGLATLLPGMNVCYRSSVFDDIDPSLLTAGFWETTLHQRLIDAGAHLFSSNSIELAHCKKFSLGLFSSQRFIYSRYFAALRFPREARMKRLAACAGSLLLPPLLLYRMQRQVRAKGRLRGELLRATPYLAWFVLIWAVGEMWGYAFGAQGALEAIE